MEGCVGALVGEMSEERKALVRKVRGTKEGTRKAEREGERGEERGRGGGREGVRGKKRGEGMRGSNYPKGGLHFYFRCFKSWTAKREVPFDWVRCTGSSVLVDILP